MIGKKVDGNAGAGKAILTIGEVLLLAEAAGDAHEVGYLAAGKGRSGITQHLFFNWHLRTPFC